MIYGFNSTLKIDQAFKIDTRHQGSQVEPYQRYDTVHVIQYDSKRGLHEYACMDSDQITWVIGKNYGIDSIDMLTDSLHYVNARYNTI